jgi:two-component system response regulator PilR (NtrC family)
MAIAEAVPAPKASKKPGLSPFCSNIIGKSSSICKVFSLIEKVQDTDSTVLIQGESGTGKELIAQALHYGGDRRHKPFVPVNCGAIPDHLVESEFFGYKKGSFTGATRDKEGLFQSANGGTLFLDEVADLPMDMQVKLLRAIQERAVRPIGDHREIPIDARVLSATHKDLAELVEDGKFRQDLFYRLNVIELHMPSLAERPEDVPDLAAHVLARIGREWDTVPPKLADDAIELLRDYAFPGNVRELENILERAMTLSEGDIIYAEDLHLRPTILTESSLREVSAVEGSEPKDAPARGEQDLETYLEEVERDAIVQALEATRYNKTAAARKLGISFRALRYRLKKIGIE